MEIIKNLVRRVYFGLGYFFPVFNHILLESHPDLSGNTFQLFEVMLKENLNEKYKLIWVVDDENAYEDYKVQNVFFKNLYPKNFLGKLHLLFLRATAKCIITENRFLPKMNNRQLVMYLSHGTILKNVFGKVVIGPKCDYVLYQSEFVKEITAKQLQVDIDKLVCLGYPRNDLLFKKSTCIEQVFDKNTFKKVIVWMPTFRQHKDKHRVDSTAYFPLGIPVVNDPEQIRELNQYLKEREVLLVLKPHPAQDLSVLNVQSLSNFVLLYDKDLRRNDIQLYEFIGNSDALITDYSSIYFDYLLTDKPIGLTISDVEEYGGTLGFAVDDIFEVLKGEYINDFSELLGFIDNVSKGIDETKEDRDIVKDLLNYYQDNKSAKRVYDFIKEKANFQS